ncbi:hypothetical protein PRNP1_009995 [Phytophthora ramorum]
MQSVNYFSDASCSSPVYLEATATSSCVSADCTATTTTSGDYYTTMTCPSDGLTGASDVFGTTAYLVDDMYIETDCVTPYYLLAYVASGECQSSSSGSAAIATLFSNGSAQLELYVDSTCSTATSTTSITDLTGTTCSAGNKYYSNYVGSSTSGASSGSTASSTTSGSTVSAGSTTTTSSTFLDSSGTTTTDGSGSSSSSSVSVGLIAGIAGGHSVPRQASKFGEADHGDGDALEQRRNDNEQTLGR